MTQPETPNAKPSGLKDKIWHVAKDLSRMSTGDLAMLRRGPLREGEAGAPAFWRLSVGEAYGFPASEEWAAIIEAMALLTRRNPDGKGHQSPHGKNSLGKALCDGGDSSWGSDGAEPRPALSELRLARLLNSHSKQRRDMLLRAVRMLARSGTQINCTDIANFILARPGNDVPARAIAKSYYSRLDRISAKASKETA